MKMTDAFILGLISIWAFTSYATESKMSFDTKEIKTYPYVASVERADTIRGGYKKVVTNMSRADVKAILGEPDEILPLYEPIIINGTIIGYTYWYVIRRLSRTGSVNDKKESIVRINFNLDDRVSRVDSWGLDAQLGNP